MDPIELAKAAVYGVVEGVTEWLPISSTGHMLLLNQFLTMDVSEDFWNMFLVVIQLGAILAVCVMFFHRLNPFSPSKTAGEKRDTWSLWGKTIVACIPAAAIGIPIDDWMEANLGSPFVIAAALIRLRRRLHRDRDRARAPRHRRRGDGEALLGPRPR